MNSLVFTVGLGPETVEGARVRFLAFGRFLHRIIFKKINILKVWGFFETK